MRLAVNVFFVSVLLFPYLEGIAQSPVAGFNLASQGCLNQNIKPVNTSTNGTGYIWDVCEGDLALTPVGTGLGNVGGSVVEGLDVVFDGQKWFGFVASRGTGSIIRLDFGTDLNATPTAHDLGNIGGVLGSPDDIKVVREGPNWYGFVYSEGTPSTLISRIKFGTSLENTATTPFAITADVVATGASEGNGGFDMVKSGTSWIILYALPSSVGIIRLADIDAIPTAADKLVTGALSGASFLGDIKIVSFSGQWFAYAVAWGSKTLHRLSFGVNLFSIPVDADITGSLIPGLTPYGIDGGFDAGNYYLLLSTLEGSLIRINAGSNLSSPPVSGSSLGNLSVIGNTLKVKLVNYHSRWTGFSIAYNTQDLYRIAFPSPSCGSATPYFEQFEPVIQFGTAGQKFITLKSFDDGGNSDEVSHAINVVNSQAPVIDFQNQNICAGFPVTFTYQSAQSLNPVHWDFGNGDTSSQTSPSEIFAAPGNYAVTLSATAVTTGCDNFVTKNITLFEPPAADFVLPAPALTCTNQSYTFTNTTQFDPDSNPTWQWSVAGSPVASTRDLAFAFSNTASQSLQLTATIPGCSSSMTRNFLVQQQGPVVDFSASNGCQGSAISFTNHSSGSIAGYNWVFGDGHNASATDAQNTYLSIGSYMVSLSARGTAGCVNSTSKQITVYTKPQADFSLDLPPFSCSGSPSQFNDVTPNPTDSNLSTWSWNFGDPAAGTSADRDPRYTFDLAGPYTVSMRVTTNFGCSTTVQKPVTITQSPIASFTNDPACVNQGTQFTDTSSGSIKSWLWKIGSSNYSFDKPIHVFASAANYSVQLTVTDVNGCIGQTSRSVSVPAAQLPDFAAHGTCATMAATFQDITPAGTDPLISYGWDFADQGTGSGSPVQFTFPSSGNFSVKMSAQAASGCVYTVTRTIAIVAPPQAGFIASAEVGAAPLHVEFENTSTNANTFLWHFHDQDNTTSTQVDTAFTFENLGDYVVDLDASNVQGCTNTFSKVIRAVSSKVDASLSDLNFVRDPSSGQWQASFVISNDGNLPLTNPAIVMEISGVATLRETLNMVVAPGATSSQALHYSILPDGLAYACLRVEVPQDENATNDKECVSLDKDAIVFAPYPNPADGELHLDWIANGDEPARLTIFNASGAKAFDRRLESAHAGLNQIRLDISNLVPGVYLAYFSYPGLKKTFRFIVN